jgi:hypothetical protein
MTDAELIAAHVEAQEAFAKDLITYARGSSDQTGEGFRCELVRALINRHHHAAS